MPVITARTRAAALVLIAMLGLPTLARAAQKNCNISSMSIIFGSYDPLTPNNTTNISMTCSISYVCDYTTGSKSVKIALNAGIHSSGGLPNRNMQLSTGTTLLNYIIYVPGSSTTVWGDGSGGTLTWTDPSGVTANVQETVSTTCVVPSAQLPAVGTYYDTVTATITHSQGVNTGGFGNDISATVPSDCTMTTTNIVFGNYDPAGTNLSTPLTSTTGSVGVTCVTGTTPAIGISFGANASGSQRRMKEATSGTYVNYDLYQDSGYSTLWGNSAGAYYSPPAAPNQSQQLYTIYAQVPAGQDASVGTYSDTLTANVNF